MPELGSKEVMHSIELFASFFIPFYFFHAGLAMDAKYFGYESLMWGGVFLGIVLPLRVAYVIGHRLPLARESFRISNRIAVTMLPTLVFTLVLTGLLVEQYPQLIAEYPWIIGGLIIYTLVNTLVPGFFLSKDGPTFELDHYGLSARYTVEEARAEKTRRKTTMPSPPTAALEPKALEPKMGKPMPPPPRPLRDSELELPQPMDMTPPQGGPISPSPSSPPPPQP